MRALLVQPPHIIPRSWLPYFPQEPLALEYLAAQGHEVRILDCIAEGWNNLQGLPDGLVRVGLSESRITQAIKTWQPQIVGVTMPFSNQMASAQRVLALAKLVDGQISTIAGGAAACVNPEKLLRSTPDLDIVVVGEGELTFRDLLNRGERDQIDGIAYRHRGMVFITKRRFLLGNLDELTFPRRETLAPYSMSLFNAPLRDRMRLLIQWLHFNRSVLRSTLTQSRAFSPGKHAAILTTRGCPFNCYYCANHSVWGRTHRRRSLQNVLLEISQLYGQGARTINILDDNFNIGHDRVAAFCKEIINSGMKLNLRAASGLYPAYLDRKTLNLMKAAGFTDIYFGIESGCQRVLNEVLRKGVNLAYVLDMIRWCQEVGIKSGGYFILGTPGETLQDMENTIRFALHSGLDRVRLYTCQPIPGSPLYDDCFNKGWLVDSYDPSKALIFGSKSFIKTPDFSPEDVERVVESGKKRLRRMLEQKR